MINPPVSQIMTTLSDWLKSMGEVNAMVLGAIIGVMMCIDMGGPVNKAAYTFSVGMLTSGSSPQWPPQWLLVWCRQLGWRLQLGLLAVNLPVINVMQGKASLS